MEATNQQMYLFKYCQKGDYKSLERLLGKGSIDINQIYKYKKTEYNVFQLTCMTLHDLIDDESYVRLENRYAECARLLLENGIDIKYADPDFKSEAIEYSIFSGSSQIVGMTVTSYVNRGESLKHKDLFSLILFFSGKRGRLPDNQLKIMELLIDFDIDVNVCDYDTGEPPIYYAAKMRFKNVVELFLRKKFAEIDCDNYVDRNGRSARYYIIKSELYEGKLPNVTEFPLHEIYRAIVAQDPIVFLKKYTNDKPWLSDDDKISILLKSIQSGNDEIVEYMLDETQHIYRNYSRLLTIASKRGFYRVLNVLLDDRKIEFDFTLLQYIADFKQDEEGAALDPHVDYDKCFEILLSRSRWNLNQLDRQNKTLLEIAINKKNDGIIKTLLNFGASVIKYSTSTEAGESLVMRIKPSVLENHFDYAVHCIYEKYLHRKRFLNDKIMLTYVIRYLSILPPRYDIEPQTRTAFPPDTLVMFQEYVPETKAVYSMSKNDDYIDLLKHPFVSTFVVLKWHRVKWLFYMDFLMYLIFTSVLTFYIASNANVFVLVTMIVHYGIYVVWVAFEVTIFRFKFFLTFENFLKLIVVVLTSCLLIHDTIAWTSESHTVYVERQIQAVLVFVSITNLFFLMEHFPRVSIYVIMIKTIYKTILTSLVQYSFLLIGFASSFYLLFQLTYAKFFGTIPMALIKTVLMASRDYDSTNIGFEKFTFPHIAPFIMLAFVALISLGLLNLLTGLAVNDVQKMRANAELYGQILTIKKIHKLETIFSRAALMKRLSLLKISCLFSIYDKRAVVQISPLKKVAYVIGEYLLNVPIGSENMLLIESLIRKKQFLKM